MKVRNLTWTALTVTVLLLAPGRAGAELPGAYCDWVCVGESCRLDRSADALCDAPNLVQVSQDLEAAACLAEPVTMSMVAYADSEVFTNGFSDATAGATLGTTIGTNDPLPPPPPPKKKVLLTGFCDFLGIANPTKRILPGVEKAVKDKCGANLDLTSQCLNVNTQAIRECKVEKQIVISLGVDASTNQFRLETSAVNCFVDINGKVRCEPVCIDPTKPITSTVEAPGPWPTLPSGTTIGGFPVVKGKPGTAGDYVCNATFYWLCTQKECKPYFIHTPQFGSDKDKTVIPDLAKLICDIVAANA